MYNIVHSENANVLNKKEGKNRLYWLIQLYHSTHTIYTEGDIVQTWWTKPMVRTALQRVHVYLSVSTKLRWLQADVFQTWEHRHVQPNKSPSANRGKIRWGLFDRCVYRESPCRSPEEPCAPAAENGCAVKTGICSIVSSHVTRFLSPDGVPLLVKGTVTTIVSLRFHSLITYNGWQETENNNL